LDDLVTAQVLAAREPASLELSLATAEQVEQERATRTQRWEQRRGRAAYEVERAARQYQAVEPEHRLVARTRERAWEEKLPAQQPLEEDSHRFLQQQPRVLTREERAAIRRLAAAIPSLWNAPTTTAADRKEIIRQVVERVEVVAQGTSEQVPVRITWAGGGPTEGLLVRPIARSRARTDSAHICARVQELTAAGWSLEASARQLETDGFPPLRSKQGWSPVSVQTLRHQLGLGNTHRHGSSREALGPDEWWARELAAPLSVSGTSLLYGIQRGLVRARKECGGWQRWLVWADAAEVERWRAYRHRDIAAQHRRRWTAAQALTALPALADHSKGATPCPTQIVQLVLWLGRRTDALLAQPLPAPEDPLRAPG
jgi:hypothetical protein